MGKLNRLVLDLLASSFLIVIGARGPLWFISVIELKNDTCRGKAGRVRIANGIVRCVRISVDATEQAYGI